MNLFNQLVEHLHLDCPACFSENVETTGNVELDDYGAYLEVRCNNCNKKNFVGDGDFWDEHEIVKKGV